MIESRNYLFVVCQVGAERALKAELARQWPGFRLSYSRRGFVTFKLPSECGLADDFDLRSTFARAYGFSLGRVEGDRAAVMARDVWRLLEGRDFGHLHVWQRDARIPGDRGFEPGISPLAEEVAAVIAAAQPEELGARRPLFVNRRARPGDLVVDCVLVEPGQWWLGIHRVAGVSSRFPGGVCLTRMQGDVVSRAYWKMSEALIWSQLPLAKGDRCAEIGSAPGGSCQALLDAGLQVMGIDPAEMDESLLAHPRLIHVKKRVADMKRREFQGIRWLMADSNVAPQQALRAVESIVTHHDVHVRGMLLTLKMPDWELAGMIPEYLERVRSWGYRYVRVRHLAFNRQEICLVALRVRSMRRPSPGMARRGKRSGGTRTGELGGPGVA